MCRISILSRVSEGFHKRCAVAWAARLQSCKVDQESVLLALTQLSTPACMPPVSFRRTDAQTHRSWLPGFQASMASIASIVGNPGATSAHHSRAATVYAQTPRLLMTAEPGVQLVHAPSAPANGTDAVVVTELQKLNLTMQTMKRTLEQIVQLVQRKIGRLMPCPILLCPFLASWPPELSYARHAHTLQVSCRRCLR